MVIVIFYYFTSITWQKYTYPLSLFRIKHYTVCQRCHQPYSAIYTNLGGTHHKFDSKLRTLILVLYGDSENWQMPCNSVHICVSVWVHLHPCICGQGRRNGPQPSSESQSHLYTWIYTTVLRVSGERWRALLPLLSVLPKFWDRAYDGNTLQYSSFTASFLKLPSISRTCRIPRSTWDPG